MSNLERNALAAAWMQTNLHMYRDGTPFDMAVDCAYDLDLCEECEINGDRTFIPIYVVELAETFFPIQ
jgi:hypothetical protein